MNFRPQNKDQPELNLIPMIDVLIVLMIFLVLTTTFSRETGLELQLPKLGSPAGEAADKGVELAITAGGQFSVNGKVLPPDSRIEALRDAIKTAAGDQRDPVITISADQATPHQHVMSALDAASQLGFGHIKFAAQLANESKP